MKAAMRLTGMVLAVLAAAMSPAWGEAPGAPTPTRFHPRDS